MYMLMFLLFKKTKQKRVFTTHSTLLWPGKVFCFFVFMLQRETERAENKCHMYGLWDLPVFPEIKTVCSVFMSVSVIQCNVCAMLEHYEIWLWFQGLWKHVSVIANVTSIAYCLVVLSISLITAFIGDGFMWFGKFVFLSFHFWSIKSLNIDLHVWNLACLMGQWFLFSNNQLLWN